MTKEEIEQYIDLDNKIKNRIVQISHALKGISGTVIHKFVPDYKRGYVTEQFDKDDFIENSSAAEELHLGLSCYANDDSWIYSINKNFLCMTDAQVYEIVEYDRKEKEAKRKRQKEAEESWREWLKKEVQENEYKQYLRLKKKFEKE